MGIALALAACSSPPVTAETQWRSLDGEPVGADIVSIEPGPEHCNWDETVLLAVDHTKLGLRQSPFDYQASYVWDPSRVGIPEDLVSFAEGVPLPPDAVDTGLRAGDLELWLVLDSDRRAAYLVEDGEASGERWPELTVGCA